MKTILICHQDDDLNRQALPRWMGSFSDVVGIVSIDETPEIKRARVRREVRRLGWLRFLDVIAFRVHHRLGVQAADRRVELGLIERTCERYPAVGDVPVLTTASPNSAETREFIAGLAPDMMIARCKVILKPEIFGIPRLGTYVLHPGVCPEYRNAHGCFWALARRDLSRVGATLLKVDKGIDTGPVYGFYSYAYDERAESHLTIQSRTVFENLAPIRAKLEEIARGEAVALSTHGRASGNWGQPWLTQYLRWKRAARRGPIGLLYHDVVPSAERARESGFAGADADVYKLDVAMFAEHLGALSALPAADVLMTFDDGGVTALEPTARMLEEHGWRGHFFVVTSRLGEPGFLSRAQVVELVRRGHTVGSHSHTHPAGFSRLGYAAMVDEWRRSREILEEILGAPVETASVPGGYYSREVARATREAGYRVLYNSEPSVGASLVDGISVRGRYGVQRQTTAARALGLARGDMAPRWAQWAFWNFKKLLKRLGGDAWLAFRRWVFKARA